MKPSLINTFAVSTVPIGSGNRYLLSGMTSIFIQLEPVTSLANFAQNIASSAVVEPAVLGKI